MNKWLKIFIGLSLLGLLTAAAVYFFVYNKPHVNYEKAKPQHTLSAEVLYYSFVQDEEAAQQIYNGTVVQFDGRLDDIEVSGEMVIAMFSFGEGMFGAEGVRCTMLENHALALQEILPGTEITLKGFCAGYNGTDVIIENCSIVD
jgi:hypothetical protein